MDVYYLERLVNDQRDEFLSRDAGTSREVSWRDLLGIGRILVITGIRRCGKSTLLRQIAEDSGQKFIYLNFDDIRLSGFTENDYDALSLVFQNMGNESLMLFDEIHMAPGWERYLRRLHDAGKNIVVAGSNSSLLSDELGSHLTGRYLRQELFPFSFREFLAFNNSVMEVNSTASLAEMLVMSREYILGGGFPEYVKHRRRELLERVYSDIVYRDIIAGHGIQERQLFRELAHYLMSNPGISTGYAKLGRQLGFKSPTSVKDYIAFMEDVYLLYQVPKFDWSLKRRLRAVRKIYSVDNGLQSAVAFKVSPDMGHLLEACVFQDLKRNSDPYYFSGKSECDFVIEKTENRYQCIQVCWHLDESNLDREVAGLTEAMLYLKSDAGKIITYDQDDAIPTDSGLEIHVVSFWRWVLGSK